MELVNVPFTVKKCASCGRDHEIEYIKQTTLQKLDGRKMRIQFFNCAMTNERVFIKPKVSDGDKSV